MMCMLYAYANVCVCSVFIECFMLFICRAMNASYRTYRSPETFLCFTLSLSLSPFVIKACRSLWNQLFLFTYIVAVLVLSSSNEHISNQCEHETAGLQNLFTNLFISKFQKIRIMKNERSLPPILTEVFFPFRFKYFKKQEINASNQPYPEYSFNSFEII